MCEPIPNEPIPNGRWKSHFNMKELYNLLEKKKLNSPKRIIKFCEENKFDEVIETCVEAFTISLKANKQVPFSSLFNFSASVTLSGGSYPCSSEFCRLKQLSYLAKFSSFYSDCTTIYNPFDFVYNLLDPKQEHEISPEKFINEAINAFLITLEFKPLIMSGLIRFSNTVNTICMACKKKLDRKRKLSYKELDNTALKKLFPLLKNEIEIEYEKDSFHLAGTEPLVNEDMYIHYKKTPFIYDSKRKEDKKFKEYRI